MITPKQYDQMMDQWINSGTDQEFLAYWGMSGSELKKELEDGLKNGKSNS